MPERSKGSGEITATGQVFTGPGAITALRVITDGTNAATAVLHDNTAGSGEVIIELTVAALSHYDDANFIPPRSYTNGVYATLTGTGASCICEKAVP